MTEQVIKFFKLKTNEDIVAFQVSENEDSYLIRRPLAFSIQNEILEGKQMLNVREWIPPIVCATDEVVLLKDYVMFVIDVRDSFRMEFIEAVEFLYNVTPKEKKPKTTGKVIPMILKDPSTKPN